jgi:hypothetical protein
MFLEVTMTNLILMVARKYFRNSESYSQYDSILFKQHIGNIYRSEFSHYRTDKVYKEQTGNYILMPKKDGYLYAWQKRRKDNGN